MRNMRMKYQVPRSRVYFESKIKKKNVNYFNK